MRGCAFPLRVWIASCWLLLLRDRNGAVAQSEEYPDCDGNIDVLGDAVCDLVVNTAECGFDGGDCCECTCEDTDDHVCGEVGAGFFCLDPDTPPDCGPTASPTPSPTAGPSSSGYLGCTGYLPHIQDGFCDEHNNNAECGWDGGDCCACTCLEGLDHECGEWGEGFDCRDPDVPDGCDLANLAQCTGYTYGYQDGYCDYHLNNAECGYDGGDCCRCTCRDYNAATSFYSYWTYVYGTFSSCGVYGYDCVDPDAPTDCETEAPTPSPTSPWPECEGPISYISDGYCDYSMNNEECNYDGGDCCPCTCDSWSYLCGGNGYDCLDPAADCSTTTSSQSSTTYYDNSWNSYTTSDDSFWNDDSDDGGGFCLGGSAVGDGSCDQAYNTAACDWDGGDCCSCTCVGTVYSCGISGFMCYDSSASCYGTTSQASDGVSSDVDYSNGDDVFASRGADDYYINDDELSTGGRVGVASTGDPSASMSTTEIVGMIALSIAAFSCFGVSIVAALIFVRGKCWRDGTGTDVGRAPVTPNQAYQRPPPAAGASSSDPTLSNAAGETGVIVEGVEEKKGEPT